MLGSGGSNQCVATLVHGIRSFGVKPEICHMSKDKPDLDNTLNMLTTLSAGATVLDFGSPGRLSKIFSALFGGGPFTSKSPPEKVFPLGGNNISGVLGQIGAALELAEQIEQQLMPDPARIYLPVGSGCTLTGLCIGTAIARSRSAMTRC